MQRRGIRTAGLISTRFVALVSFVLATASVVGVNLGINRSIDLVVDPPMGLQVPPISDLSKAFGTHDGGLYCVGFSGDSAVLTRFASNGDRISNLTVTNNRIDKRDPVILGDSFQEDHDGNLLYQLAGSGVSKSDTIFRARTNGSPPEAVASGIFTHIFPIKDGYIVGAKPAVNDEEPLFRWYDNAFAPISGHVVRGPAGSWESFSLSTARRFLVVEPDGAFVYAGTCSMRRLTKIASDGSVLWDRQNKENGTTTPSVGQNLAALIRTSDGGFLLAGTDFVNGPDVADYLLVKTDSAGVLEWIRRFGGPGVDELQSVQRMEDGGYLLCGNSASEEASGGKGVLGRGVWIIQTDARGLKRSETVVPYASWNVGLARSPGGFEAIGFEGYPFVSAVHRIHVATTIRAHVSARSEGGRPFNVDVSNDLIRWTPLVIGWGGDLELRDTVSPGQRFWRAYEVP